MEASAFTTCSQRAVEQLAALCGQSSATVLLPHILRARSAMEQRVKNAMFSQLFGVEDDRFSPQALASKNIFVVLQKLEGAGEFFEHLHRDKDWHFRSVLESDWCAHTVLAQAEELLFEATYLCVALAAAAWFLYLLFRLEQEQAAIVEQLAAFRPSEPGWLRETGAHPPAADASAAVAAGTEEALDCFDFYETELGQVLENLGLLLRPGSPFAVAAPRLFPKHRQALLQNAARVFAPAGFLVASPVLSRRRFHFLCALIVLCAVLALPCTPPPARFLLHLLEELVRGDRHRALAGPRPQHAAVALLNHWMRAGVGAEWRSLAQQLFCQLLEREASGAGGKGVLRDYLITSLAHAAFEPAHEREAVALLAALRRA